MFGNVDWSLQNNGVMVKYSKCNRKLLIVYFLCSVNVNVDVFHLVFL